MASERLILYLLPWDTCCHGATLSLETELTLEVNIPTFSFCSLLCSKPPQIPHYTVHHNAKLLLAAYLLQMSADAGIQVIHQNPFYLYARI